MEIKKEKGEKVCGARFFDIILQPDWIVILFIISFSSLESGICSDAHPILLIRVNIGSLGKTVAGSQEHRNAGPFSKSHSDREKKNLYIYLYYIIYIIIYII